VGRHGEGLNGEGMNKLRHTDYQLWKERYPEAYRNHRRAARKYARKVRLTSQWRPGSPGRIPIDLHSDEYARRSYTSEATQSAIWEKVK